MGKFTEQWLHQLPEEIQIERAEKDEANFEQDVQEALQVAQSYLANRFGVEQITTTEGVKLRDLIRDSMEQRNRERKMVRNGEITGIGIAPPAQDAVHRWLLDEYGIDVTEMKKIKLTPDEQVAYIQRIRERAHEPGIQSTITRPQ